MAVLLVIGDDGGPRSSQAERVYFRKSSRASAGIPDSTKTSLHQKLARRQRERWPQLKEVRVRFRARFAYVDGVMHNGEVLSLCRLRYGGYANDWGFAFYAAAAGPTRTRSCLPALSSGRPRRPSTVPAGRTSVTPPPGSRIKAGQY